MPQMLRTKYRKIKGWKNMKEIKIVIADDNTYFCKFLNDYLKKYEDIEILETANNDDDEIRMIEELKPDIVIIEDANGSTELVRPLRDKGIKVALLRTPETVKDVEDQTRNVGRLLGRKDKAESLIGTMMNYIRDTESLRFARRDEPKKTVAVYNQNGLYGKSKTLVADMLTYVVVDNAAIKSGVRLTDYGTKADLIKADPDVIIVPMDTRAPDYNRDAVYASYYNDPALVNLKAIMNKKIAIVSNESMLAKTYHVGRGIYSMAQVVYER